MKINFFRFKKGFTLIELLVVIAIISLLSTVVMASLNQSKIKAQEAAIKQDLQSIKTQAELSHSKTGDYSTVETDIAPILAHINKNGGTAVSYTLVYNSVSYYDHYAVSVKFNSDTTKNWSVSDQYGISTWYLIDSGTSDNLINAQTACASSGGRVPTVQELVSLYRTYGKTPDIITSSIYWSNTPDYALPGYYFRVSMNSAQIISAVQTNSYRTHCIK